MALTDFFKPIQRNSPNSPTTSLANPASWLTALFSPRAKSGVSVGTNNVISLSAVWRAISLISQSIAILPFEVIEEEEDGALRIAKDHKLFNILRREPSPLYTTFNFLRSLVAQALIFGDGYAVINRDEDGFIRSFKLIDRSVTNVQMFLDDTDQVFYKVSPTANYGPSEPTIVPGRNMIHLPNLSLNGLTGLEIIGTHRDNFGLGLAARNFGNTFFAEGTFLSGYLTTPMVLDDESYSRVSRSWSGAYAGSGNAGKVAILEQGMEFKPLSMKPQDASMLETQKFNIEEIARIFGVPPHLLYALDRSTFNNIEHLGQEFASYTAFPWAENIEQEFTRKVFTEEEKRSYFMRLDMTALLRADTESRTSFYRGGIQNGYMTVNEVRAKEGLNPVEGGDENYIQLNMTTIKALKETAERLENLNGLNTQDVTAFEQQTDGEGNDQVNTQNNEEVES